ncbi:alpha/beta hydrolase [Oceanomicrobium pacificus]|uniref:Alpha/beta fold hydrolase n=1 Tax=Oceanomicrobium pacificus TaxID=2692916 RepID=A0A6B0TML6_9RHOB|nr:alpha/beta hydrolase [Oceanomicrobium pacificus]MXU65757.1 alpha/beta fold hydrolase [Oceanomicrobium pacificus]
MKLPAPITDWDDAYANRDHIPGAEGFVERWQEDAPAFRAELDRAGRLEADISYGPEPRQAYDLFRPTGESRGLLMFVHGGYWRMFDKSTWSHFARGALAHGWTVVMPSYRLAPQVHISDVVADVGAALIDAAGRVDGPIRLAGHSAGGHLVTRLICTDSAVPGAIVDRIAHVMSISGVHDLRPLLKLELNSDFRLDPARAVADSPALLTPRADMNVSCWVGAAERPEFLRQNDLLALAWFGLCASVSSRHVAGCHHFDVIDGLADPDSDMMAELLG